MTTTLLICISIAAGVVVGYALRVILSFIRKHSSDSIVAAKLLSAREQAQDILSHAQEAQLMLITKEKYLDEQKKIVEEKIHAQEKMLEEISGITKKEAREKILEKLSEDAEQDFFSKLQKLESLHNEHLALRAKEIIASAVQRLAVTTTSELTTTNIPITDDEVKAKIIGRDGRNIKTFERATGVELLVDETENAIVISSFDPQRRAIAASALHNLLADGRIHPAKIEEEVELAKQTVHKAIKEHGMRAVAECGLHNIDPHLITLIGTLHFRTSYGQNVLEHSIETAHLAGLLAEEIGANVTVAKTAGLLHDIGKALDHEFDGTHISLGIKVLRKFSVDEAVVTAMKSHHDDVPHESIEAVIVQTADILSASRPGTRRQTSERYINRLSELESLASTFAGVEKVYALQAGRELRIFVHPENISDLAAKQLARDVAIQIETELRYPGEIKITIIRETRVIDYAR